MEEVILAVKSTPTDAHAYEVVEYAITSRTKDNHFFLPCHHQSTVSRFWGLCSKKIPM